MRILKFGGSSVANASNINKVIDIVAETRRKGQSLIMVVSALGGITDNLMTLATLASKKDRVYEIIFKNICQRHIRVIAKLIAPKDRERIFVEIAKKYAELDKIVKNIFLTGETSPPSLDAILSFGEQFSSYIISEAIKNRGVHCQFVDTRTIIKTDNNFGEANVDTENSYKLVAEYFKEKKKNRCELFVMGGFIASTKEGVTTTLGRGGSDYTASLVGAALDASSIEIWTDIDGLMTADPRKVKDAVIIPEISYEKAEEMAYSGAKVIYPKAIKPAWLRNIPIYIKNTFNPLMAGTKISNENGTK